MLDLFRGEGGVPVDFVSSASCRSCGNGIVAVTPSATGGAWLLTGKRDVCCDKGLDVG